MQRKTSIKKIELIKGRKYREDIDGLRAIAVLAVIIFHFGHLPAGYLGVDIFFVISGFLITGIIYKEHLSGKFSLKDFYLRRIKRIIPLVLFICTVALVLGIAFMLPDDLENLAQSVIATNFFNNNTLQILTTKNYWDVVNEFKPLMHTWSLGIEEQYYLVYPFLFLMLGRLNSKWILWSLIALTLLSLGLFVSPFPEYIKFYTLPFRFFELSIGGVAAIILNGRLIQHNFSPFFLVLLAGCLIFGLNFIPESPLLVITVLLTCGVLITANRTSIISKYLLENRLMVFIGKISFSLYMWHQVLLAFARTTVYHEINIGGYALIFALTIVFSALTYYLIEQPFRKRFSTKTVLVSVLVAFIVTTGVSYYIYKVGGVIRDIPELGLTFGQGQRNIHAKYNDRINSIGLDFKKEPNKLKVLIVGNSFARDWANVLLESKNKDRIDISYSPIIQNETVYFSTEADIIFISEIEKHTILTSDLPINKIWYVGTKNFGINNGLFYNYSGQDYCQQRTKMESGYLLKNDSLKMLWGDRYIDLISRIIDDNGTVPVFEDDCMFISQDCRHLTKAGAKFFAHLFEDELDEILEK
ncbi:Peptidoglycan/LPS O-acetylase OafA/YrhL, contains acyltransferase and SGNH-hydrolase domains [Robiginitalea myxolifaciens]|uniref:Peptidoglycan/LPS O-acetylase OafA/YrhL, contains acyltransferase and SGNH-hydrolase domains n=1 Tax=Robiginitalea myxolifaciens TaxID=400055 RepID=A0A1I6FMZ8_9FLAO|nr:acyltransferase [Robiginitalea myxolifaciens]SFR31335.1 Peptidoglycan/LPS O-acetylase OafA/YrhL, contains acyltransferase and SGNH-hydrolase domains [Robiginitalea myxolifaciens]